MLGGLSRASGMNSIHYKAEDYEVCKGLVEEAYNKQLKLTEKSFKGWRRYIRTT